MRHAWLGVVFAIGACAVAGDEGGYSSEGSEAALSSGLVYFYVSPTPADSQGFGPLALRRANAKPTTFSPTYGAATLPAVRLAADALTSQAALDAVLAVPYAGNENRVIAIIGGRNKSSPAQTPLVEVVELYTPNQPVAIADAQGMRGVAQRDALFTVGHDGNKVVVTLVNEKDYPKSSSVAFDWSGSTNPAGAMTAVQGGALFTASVDIVCKPWLVFWTKCDPPSGVHVAAYFSAN